MSDLQPPTSQTIKIKPIINYPREAQAGQTYLMTIDLQLASPDTLWPYPEEEYPITFTLNTQPYFYYESLDEGCEPGVILHRFGGTYGPATYLLTATEQVVEPGHISITFMNKWGIPVTHMELDCAVRNRFEKDIKPEVIIEHKNVISVPEERATEDTGSYVPKEENTQNAGKEKTSKELIVEQLMQTGWDILDGNRARPSISQGVAVANYPTFPGDYLLYIGSRPIGIVKVFRIGEPLAGSEEPVPALPILHSLAAFQEPTSPATYGSARYGVSRYEGIEESYPILPFVYETTGIETRFTNFLEPEPRSRALFTFHRPETLAGWLQQAPPNIPTTRNNLLRSRLQRMPLIVNEDLNQSQYEAIISLERSLAENHSRTLIQMASGKGRMAVSAIDHLLKFSGAKRILYIVDRVTLAHQITARLRHYGISTLLLQNDHFNPDTSVYVITIQRLHSILFGKFNSEQVYSSAMPIEYFDIIFIDECHRSIYNKWQPNLEYFDAFLIGLTATPDDRAFAFFNHNLVYEYRQDQAVKDNIMVDYEVYRMHIEIAPSGIISEYESIHSLQAINNKVITVDQLRIVINLYKSVLFTELFPERREVPKTIIFAQNDNYADSIMEIVHEIFGKGNDFVKKLTSKVADTRPENIVAAFCNSYNPRIVVMVNMVTGIDFKAVEVLLFLRSVYSRNLLYQMISLGCKTIADDELHKVTPDAHSKTHCIVIDPIGVTDYLGFETFSTKKETDLLFAAWLNNQQHAREQPFTEEQIKWLERIRDHIATNLKFEEQDLDLTPFTFDGGRVAAHILFGNELSTIIQELNMRLLP